MTASEEAPLNTDLEHMTPGELALEFARLQSNRADRARESLARREALEREHPHLLDGPSNERERVLAELTADLDAASQKDGERLDAMKLVLLARITAP
jgi:hypothetical protein